MCTDDVMRIARVTAVGAAVEADRALRARDLREPETETDALARARIHLDRLAAAAEDGGPVERAWLAVGHGRAGTRAAAHDDPALWQEAAEQWDGLGRPYCAALGALAPGRGAGRLPSSARPRRSVAAQALEVAERLGAGWLSGELHGSVRAGAARAGREPPRAATATPPRPP